MTKISRKAFLGLSTAAAATAALSHKAAAQASAPAMPNGPARPTLIKGADLLTMDPKLKEMKAADVLIKDGKIAAIGANLSSEGAEVVDAKGMILMPGMVDGHRHVWEILDSGRIVRFHPTQFATYQNWKMRTFVCLTPEDHYLGGLAGGLQALDSGVTSILDFAHGQINPETVDAAARGLKDSGIGGWYAMQLGVAPSYKPGDTVPLAQAESQRITDSGEEHWKTAAEIQKKYFSDSSAPLQFALAPSTGIGDKISDIKEEWARCRATGVKLLAAHIHKPVKPHPEGHMGHRGSGMLDLYEAGLLGPDYHLSHGNRLTTEELKLLAETGGMIAATAMCEIPYVAISNRGAPVHGRAREAGVAAGIGIDVGMSLTEDYFEHVRAAFWSLYLEPEGMAIAAKYKSEDTLDFATALGAKAIRMGDVTGSITVGKRADLVLLNTSRFGFAMQGTLADRVVTFASRQDVDSVWVAGSAKKRNGAMLGVDWAKLKSDMAAAQARFGALAATVKFT